MPSTDQKKENTKKSQCLMHNVLQNTQEEELNSTQIHNKHDHQKTQ